MLKTLKKLDAVFEKIVVAVMCLLIVIFAIKHYQMIQAKKAEAEAVRQEEKSLRNIALSYMVAVGYSGERFYQQVTHAPVKLDRWIVDQKMIYFLIPKSKYTRVNVLQMSRNPKTFEFAKYNSEKGGYLLGTRISYLEDFYYFRIPEDDLAIDTKQVFKFPLGNYEYKVSLRELRDLIHNKNLCGEEAGKEFIRDDERGLPNHGPFVAKVGEPSLKRLTAEIISGTDSNEAKAQRLLDFVTEEITYDHELASAYDVQYMQRPNEVLMKGSGTCSGKSILYASLLEQAGVKYRFLYVPEHITVCVTGNFSNYNGLAYKIGGEKCAIAETTVPGFRIGETSTNGNYTVKFTQRPPSEAVTKDGDATISFDE